MASSNPVITIDGVNLADRLRSFSSFRVGTGSYHSSPTFIRTMRQAMLGGYDLPDCDEISLDIYDDPADLTTVVEIRMFEIHLRHRISQRDLQAGRSADVALAYHILTLADCAWTAILAEET